MPKTKLAFALLCGGLLTGCGGLMMADLMEATSFGCDDPASPNYSPHCRLAPCLDRLGGKESHELLNGPTYKKGAEYSSLKEFVRQCDKFYYGDSDAAAAAMTEMSNHSMLECGKYYHDTGYASHIDSQMNSALLALEEVIEECEARVADKNLRKTQ